MSERNKVAVITAGGSGMGAAVARKLAAVGYSVAVSSSSNKARALADEVGGFGMVADNQNVSECDAFIAAVAERFGRIDVLVNSAGHGPRGDLLGMSDEEWHRGMDIYFLSAVRFIRLATPHLLAAGGGAIVNVSTYGAVEPEAVFPTSAVFRAGLANFVKIYADTYAKQNIRINNVLPGFIKSFPEKAEITARIPMGRYGELTEIADTVAFLVSPGAGYITGQNIRVDGGITRST